MCGYDLGKFLGQAAELCPHRRVQGLGVNTFRNGRLVVSTLQTGSSAFTRPMDPTRGLPGLPVTTTLRWRLAT
jgi:hypothetical protein